MALQPKHTGWISAAGEIGFILVASLSVWAAILLSLLYIPGIPTGAIHWPALVILYWACYQPRWLPLIMVFIMGVLCDLLSGTELIGLTAFIAILLSILLRSQNALILSLPFWMVWLIVAGLMFCWRMFEIMAQGLMIGVWPSPMTWLVSVLLSALAFPLVAILLAPLRRAEFRF